MKKTEATICMQNICSSFTVRLLPLSSLNNFLKDESEIKSEMLTKTVLIQHETEGIKNSLH